MFRNPDDDLYSRIFDDGESGDSRMEWLRDGLKELREVPPHGLSNERLRDRLLGTGLAPVKPRPVPWWSWAWAPVAAAALAVVILPRLSSTSEPTLVLEPGTVAIRGADTTRPEVLSALRQDGIRLPETASADELDIEGTLAAMAMELPSSRSAVDRSERRTFRRSPRVNNVRPPVSTGAKPPVRETPQPNAGLVASARRSTEESPATPMTFKSDATTVAALVPDVPTTAPSQTSYPLVLLASEIDASTGAALATEVTSSANLSVGG